ncbi:hypothetical protein BH11BAC1_BH11BAC1_02130 [soil metagenome]
MKTTYWKILIVMFLSAANGVSAGLTPVKSPITFLKNKGQWQPEILYQGTAVFPNVYFLKNGLCFGQSGEEIENPDGTDDHPYMVWNMDFLNTGKNLKISGTGEKKSVVSYLSGNDPGKWVVQPEEYQQLSYQSIYDDIDLTFYGVGHNLKYDFIVHKGGDIQAIRSSYRGIKNLSVNANGELEIVTQWNTQKQQAPIAWQMIGNRKQFVKVNYIVSNDSVFGFEAMNDYNKNFDLIIDPLFEMAWSTYTAAFGSSNNLNYCFSNAMDKDGNVYLTGMVDGTFPVTPGVYSGAGTVSPEIFVAKFSSDGTTLLYSTYLPANSSEHGIAIAADDSGRAYVTGIIDLNWTGITDYPSTANAYQPVHNVGSDAFLTVLNPTGTGLVYSSFLGGTGSESGYGIALGGYGIAYITGNTSTGNFPTKATTFYPTGDDDVFVAKFDINQSGNNSLIYSTRIGGGSFSYCKSKSIAVNSAGNAFITGTMGSGFGIPVYPTTAGVYSNVYNTGQDGVMSFVTKLSANTPITLDYSTYLVPGTANAIAVDSATGDAFIAGATNTFAFPVTAGALQPVHGGNNGTDAFAIRLNSTGSALVYSTFLGGYWGDDGTGIAVNSIGEAYITGITQDSFPTSAGAFQPNGAGTYDFFVVNLNASGTGYGCGGSTFVGGSDADYSGSFYDYSSPHLSLIDHGGINDTICLSSTSHSQDFPTTAGSYQPLKINGIGDQPVFFKMTCANSALPVSGFSAPDSICPGTCTDFTNISQNASSFQWSFPGATISSSTDVNPTGICYNIPGSYDVTLIAMNGSGNDTVTIPGYITVYPSPAPQGIQQSGDTLTANQGAVSYQWYFNGNIINGASNYFYIALQGGDYNLVATDGNGCEVEAVIFNVIAGLQSTINSQQLMVFPNPVGDKLILHNPYFTREATIDILIYDIPGEIVLSVSPLEFGEGQDVEADVSQLPPGIYWIKWSDGEKKFTGKFVKQ